MSGFAILVAKRRKELAYLCIGIGFSCIIILQLLSYQTPTMVLDSRYNQSLQTELRQISDALKTKGGLKSATTGRLHMKTAPSIYDTYDFTQLDSPLLWRKGAYPAPLLNLTIVERDEFFAFKETQYQTRSDHIKKLCRSQLLPPGRSTHFSWRSTTCKNTGKNMGMFDKNLFK
jgi:hypothetical protein